MLYRITALSNESGERVQLFAVQAATASLAVIKAQRMIDRDFRRNLRAGTFEAEAIPENPTARPGGAA